MIVCGVEAFADSKKPSTPTATVVECTTLRIVKVPEFSTSQSKRRFSVSNTGFSKGFGHSVNPAKTTGLKTAKWLRERNSRQFARGRESANAILFALPKAANYLRRAAHTNIGSEMATTDQDIGRSRGGG